MQDGEVIKTWDHTLIAQISKEGFEKL
jgi:hypothetical protein